MNKREKITVLGISRDVLKQMKKVLPDLILSYLKDNEETVNHFKLRKLRQKFDECGGNSSLLLSKFLPKRVKFFENGTYGRVSFMTTIVGAEEFLVIYDCTSRTIRLEERPVIEPLEC